MTDDGNMAGSHQQQKPITGLHHAHDIAVDRSQLPLARRVHGAMLDRYYPRPDLLICLDAPGDVLFARKGEGSPAMLEARRQEYLRLRDAVPHYVLVDATQSLDAVTEETGGIILRFYASQSGEKVQNSPRIVGNKS